MTLQGVAVSPGVATGRIVFARAFELPRIRAADTPDRERERLDRAVAQARGQLEESPAQRDVLDNPDLLEFSWELVAGGAGAVAAWHRAFSRLADRTAHSPGELFAKRAIDVREAGRRVLLLLASADERACPDNAILVGEHITIADIAVLYRHRVLGVCAVADSPPQVVEYIRGLRVPAVSRIDRSILNLPAGTTVLLDGTKGQLTPGPHAGGGASPLKRFARLVQRGWPFVR